MSTTQQIERVRAQLVEALNGVRTELAKSQSGQPAVDSEANLVWIASGLEAMLVGLRNADRPEPPGLWHVVTDTWPHNSTLGDKVIEAEYAYQRLL